MPVNSEGDEKVGVEEEETDEEQPQQRQTENIKNNFICIDHTGGRRLMDWRRLPRVLLCYSIGVGTHSWGKHINNYPACRRTRLRSRTGTTRIRCAPPRSGDPATRTGIDT